MRRYWKIFGVLAPFLFVAAGIACAQAVKSLPRPVDFVSDDAHVLSQGTIQQLDQLCGAVQRQAHAQIAVVTVQNTDGEAISQYAVALEDAWKVGAKGTDRGVIVLVSTGDRKWFISTGYGLEGVITDERAGIIGRRMDQYLHAGQFDAGLTLGTQSLAVLIANDAGVRLSVRAPGARAPQRGMQLSGTQVAIGLGVLVLLLVLAARTGLLPFLLGMFLGGGFGGGGGGGSGGGDGDGGDGFSGFGGGSTGGGGAGGSF